VEPLEFHTAALKERRKGRKESRFKGVVKAFETETSTCMKS